MKILFGCKAPRIPNGKFRLEGGNIVFGFCEFMTRFMWSIVLGVVVEFDRELYEIKRIIIAKHLRNTSLDFIRFDILNKVAKWKQ